jgi:hypothetical protein
MGFRFQRYIRDPKGEEYSDYESVTEMRKIFETKGVKGKVLNVDSGHIIVILPDKVLIYRRPLG